MNSDNDGFGPSVDVLCESSMFSVYQADLPINLDLVFFIYLNWFNSCLCLYQETYPSTPPVWFADVEDPSITNAVQILSNTSGRENHVRQHIAV